MEGSLGPLLIYRVVIGQMEGGGHTMFCSQFWCDIEKCRQRLPVCMMESYYLLPGITGTLCVDARKSGQGSTLKSFYSPVETARKGVKVSVFLDAGSCTG